MKIALLNDTHFGCRNDSPAFMEHQNKFYNELFFPYIKRNNIKCLIHLGDVVDRRKFINHNTAHNFKRVFWDRLDDMGIETHIIIGNHDTYYKNTNEVNALQNLNISQNAIVYTHATNVELDGLKILFIPWICDDNEPESIRTIANSTAGIAMGHLEIKGFEMHSGHMNDHGYEKNMFVKFEKVISGHFHKKSDDGHIYYLGTQYEMTWSDYNCPKGFHIFDTSTRELGRVENTNKMFKKITYNDKEINYDKFDITPYDKCFIKLFISNKSDNDMYERLMDKFYNHINVHAIDVIEDPTDIGASVPENLLEQGEDTLTFLNNYIDNTDIKLDKQKLKQFAKDLYMEAKD